ncbi:hypothetical protein U1Q18_033362 [Sarracenia purpurea var. burkii]
MGSNPFPGNYAVDSTFENHLGEAVRKAPATAVTGQFQMNVPEQEHNGPHTVPWESREMCLKTEKVGPVVCDEGAF